MQICTKQKYKGKRRSNGLLSHTPHRLSEALGAYLRTNKRRPLTTASTLVNWGCTEVSNLSMYDRILNHPESVKNSVDKKITLQLLKENDLPHTAILEDIDAAKSHIDAGGWVVCRTLTRSSGGKGIIIAKTIDELVPAPLYTVYFKKSHEYRYHVFNGEVIDVQKKMRLSSEELEARGFSERPPSYIRNLENGYIFGREGVETDRNLSIISIKAVEALGLDFGSVDILTNITNGGMVRKHVICEVNSASGLSGTTFDKYVEKLGEYNE